MSTRVLLLRHAESADPTVFHGAESDIELSQRGHQQAKAVARVIAPMKPDVIICSGMKRAIATAIPIAMATLQPFFVEQSLHERRVGALSGIKFDASDSPWAETLNRWIAGDTGYAPAEAESWDAMKERLLPTWHRITTEHAGKTIVIVSHGLVCKVLLCELLQEWSVADWYRIGPMYNTAIHDLRWEDGAWRAAAINQREHLNHID